MEKLELTNIRFTWLKGGVTHLDGGAMFGVVPKPLWSRKYDVNDKNQIELRTDPILIQANGKNYLVESGIGNGKLTDKQKRNFGVDEESEIEQSLEAMGLSPLDIDYVLMTHMHYDHANGLTKEQNGEFVSVFPNATIVSSEVEWDELRNPNIRSKATYWKENWEPIQEQVVTFKEEWNHGPFKMVHTGGHSDGHSIIIIEDEGETVVHMADLMATHAHQNVLWVMAYDDYPMDSIAGKQKWMKFAQERNAWFTFYHDAVYRAIKLDEYGAITTAIKREK
ncbi:Glyoxylase, beta-lactamase superfamily II [Mesobacillus persicus]|uniref:Glyoxylase, beta-lactamase superfamily II n=1 Tax=Mesobacillus persicus TaxID=930146 RepID=A0A1H7Y062_9BACI|nr:MBL fold metallo-hydrolase [Mesobacillus persicus]SEM39264.1 Glyoxylase, beta-lactamase superfamily II [Mesobacillus persicus]